MPEYPPVPGDALQRYLTSPLKHCPWCESTRLTIKPPLFPRTGTGITVLNICQDCGKRWRDLYERVGIEPEV
ncbi:MAG: hypothetical protein AB1916_04835 [Thermodesulfobacteriota bacterium]